ncbi:MAG: hypothetical protein JST73_08645 [Actinobacteria bacterium]|nr:hypothetical protein [Actinomycetota bacterium]
MKRRSIPRAVAVVTAVLLLGGCGASTSAVVKALPPKPTQRATTVAPTTTEPPTTEAPSTDAPTSSEALPPASTDPSAPPTSGGSGSLPAEAQGAFMRECQSGGQPAATCDCIWNAIKGDLDIDTLLNAGSSGSLPPDLEKKIIDATMGCVTTSSS